MKKTNKHILSGIMLILLCFLAIGSTEDNNSSSNSSSKNWYEGGTLHYATVAEWKNASYVNKLATAADWAASSPKGKELFKATGDVNSLKPYALSIISCVNEATAGEGTENMKIAEIAASCLILMGNNY
jgi:hypothetical protein